MSVEPKDIVKFLTENVEPVTDIYSEKAYRAAAVLKDGTYLPCVMFRKTSDVVGLAMRRFDETRGKKLHPSVNYESIVKTFMAGRNVIAPFHVDKVEKSPFALPAEFYRQICASGETSMSWHQFTAKMRDGKIFSFGSSCDLEFFELQQGSTMDDIVEVSPHKKTGGDYLKPKIFFDCLLDEL